MYCNQMYWGHRAYGVEAASQLYFAKPAKDLTLDEAAMIAGIIQSNVRQSPYVNMKAAVRRRNYTLDRMVAEGFITAADAEAAKKRAIVTRGAADAAALDRALLPRNRPHPPRGAVRREGGVRKRSGHQDRPRSGPAARRECARSTPACASSTSSAATGSRRATSSTEKRALETYRHPRWRRELDRRRRSCPRVVTERRRRRHDRVRVGRCDRHDRPRRLRVDEAQGRRTLARPAISIEVRIGKIEPKGDVHGDARTGAAARGRGARDRQPDRAGPGDGRRLELRARASSTARRRRCARSARSSSRSSTRRRSPRATRRARCSRTSRQSFDAGPGQPPYEPKNYDREFRGHDHAPAARSNSSRNVPTMRLMAGAGAAERDSVRAAARHHLADSAVSLGRDRRRRRHAARDDVGLLGVPQSGRAHDAADGPRGHRSRRQRSSNSIAPNRTRRFAPTPPTS